MQEVQSRVVDEGQQEEGELIVMVRSDYPSLKINLIF